MGVVTENSDMVINIRLIVSIFVMFRLRILSIYAYCLYCLIGVFKFINLAKPRINGRVCLCVCVRNPISRHKQVFRGLCISQWALNLAKPSYRQYVYKQI